VRAEVEPAGPAEAGWLASEKRWGQGWRRLAFHAVLLLYLIYVVRAVDQYSQGVGAVVGYALLGAFAIGFLVIMPDLESIPPRRFWALCGMLFALFVAQLAFAQAEAFTLAGYLTIVIVRRLGSHSIPVVAGFTIGAIVLPVAVPSWHDSLATGFGNATAVAIPITALATYTVHRIRNGNLALAEAHAEVARLAAENERSRIARDLHDLLGHSLTTITVKTGLARRLGETDPNRALAEIAEVETLARQALADVRAAVSNYREVTLAGELATGRELLRAAGILADLPSAVDGVSPEHQELFGWVVREGLTNVVRHARATSCAVRLSEGCVEIEDDGVGGDSSTGSGLSGLAERVGAAGGAVDAGPLQPRGWRLRVSLVAQGAGS